VGWNLSIAISVFGYVSELIGTRVCSGSGIC
jgi:hypothetical protein